MADPFSHPRPLAIDENGCLAAARILLRDIPSNISTCILFPRSPRPPLFLFFPSYDLITSIRNRRSSSFVLNYRLLKSQIEFQPVRRLLLANISAPIFFSLAFRWKFQFFEFLRYRSR